MSNNPNKVVAMVDTSVLDTAITEVSKIILGKEHVIRLAVAGLIARGHLLIEDVPGVGKTTLTYALAKVFGLSYQRIQFTSDLLPTDIIGASVYNRDTGKFDFYSGPIFSHLVLADEINRATPRTQSALLEAMAEYQVTVEGETRSLPMPFYVIATQNPGDQIGTFPLPESQLDRFLMRLELGYPDKDSERDLYRGKDRKILLGEIQTVMPPEELKKIQNQLEQIHVSAALLDYLQDLLEFSRTSGSYNNGLSPRAGLALLNAAKAWSLLNPRRDEELYLLPEDIKAVLPSVVNHRLQFSYEAQEKQALNPAQHLIQNVPVP